MLRLKSSWMKWSAVVGNAQKWSRRTMVLIDIRNMHIFIIHLMYALNLAIRPAAVIHVSIGYTRSDDHYII